MAKKQASKGTKPPQRDTSAIQGVALFTTSIIFFLSLMHFSYGIDRHQGLGVIGDAIGWVLFGLFGLGSYLVCLFLGWFGWRRFFSKPINHLGLKIFYGIIFGISFCILLCLIEDKLPIVGTFLGKKLSPSLWQLKYRFHLGGAFFYYLYKDIPVINLSYLIGTAGTAIIFISSLTTGFLFLFNITPSAILKGISKLFSALPTFPKNESDESEPPAKETVPFASGESDFLRFVKLRIPGLTQQSTTDSTTMDQSLTPNQELLAIQPETNLKVRPSMSRKGQTEFAPPPSLPPSLPLPSPPPVMKKRDAAIAAQKIYNGDFASYALPSLSLLTNPKKVDQSTIKKDLRRQAEVLEETLLSFGIEAKVGQINCGPTITSFEVHPAIGVKVQKIKTLENDIALNMEAQSIRIIAPIPGKAAVGIEVPNAQPQEVAFKEMLTAYQKEARKFHIPILLGKAVNGDYVMSDLSKMPHCIIAGATGSGKSVCINTIVMSILMNAKPDEIKLVMIDPKKVELTAYSKLPHMLAPVITEPHGACAALNWLVKEMESRYEILKQIGLRNIEAFNNRVANKEHEQSLDIDIPTKLPYIVGIIDELADLMMVASNDIETPIARIAQMARAVGIHLILATQRPSREVITGLIKANFPTRISFKVASRVNSQIVLDEIGAESLLGNGDMLFLPPGTSHLVRAQGAFIRDEDINGVIKYLCEQAPPNYVIESFDRIGRMDLSTTEEAANPKDTLFEEAKDIVLSTGNASTTFLQRKLKIGYARAASLMDLLETQGLVGPIDGSKPRKILAALKSNSRSSDNLDLFEQDIEE